jgi:hypothetical protein
MVLIQLVFRKMNRAQHNAFQIHKSHIFHIRISNPMYGWEFYYDIRIYQLILCRFGRSGSGYRMASFPRFLFSSPARRWLRLVETTLCCVSRRAFDRIRYGQVVLGFRRSLAILNGSRRHIVLVPAPFRSTVYIASPNLELALFAPVAEACSLNLRIGLDYRYEGTLELHGYTSIL